MLREIPGLADNTLGYSAIGKVTAEDYWDVMIPAVEAALEKHDKIGLFYHCGPAFEGATAGAVVQDARIGLHHLKRFERIAVVTDLGWLRSGVSALGVFLPCPVRVFANNEMHAAKAWMKEAQNASNRDEDRSPA